MVEIRAGADITLEVPVTVAPQGVSMGLRGPWKNISKTLKGPFLHGAADIPAIRPWLQQVSNNKFGTAWKHVATEPSFLRPEPDPIKISVSCLMQYLVLFYLCGLLYDKWSEWRKKYMRLLLRMIKNECPSGKENLHLSDGSKKKLSSSALRQ